MNWEEIRKEYETTDVTLKTLAEKHDIKLGTLKSRKSREGWGREEPKQDATKKDATQRKKVASQYNGRLQMNTDKKETFEVSEDLTEKQRLFCVYYVKTFNATQSAIKAGYSADTAHVQGSRMLSNVKVAAEIRRIKSDMTSDLFLDAMDVLQKYVKIAFADITDYLEFGREEMTDDSGNPYEVNRVKFKESSMVDGSIISEVKQGKDGVSIKLEDKMKALDKLSLYFDLFPDKFKRQVEEEKLKLAQRKVNGDDDEEYEDDGFLEALDGKEVNWDEET
jgi:phage terminase small subunit